MKNGKTPSRAQRMILESNRLNPGNWLVVKDTGKTLEIISKENLKKGIKKTRTINR